MCNFMLNPFFLSPLVDLALEPGYPILSAPLTILYTPFLDFCFIFLVIQLSEFDKL